MTTPAKKMNAPDDMQTPLDEESLGNWRKYLDAAKERVSSSNTSVSKVSMVAETSKVPMVLSST